MMKKIVLPSLVILLVVNLFYSATDQPLYYYVGNVRYPFEMDTSLVLVEIEVDDEGRENILSVHPEIETYRIKDAQTVQLVTDINSKLLGELTARRADYLRYPAIQVKGTKGTSFVTNEISIRFKSEKAEQELIEFAKKWDLTYLRQTSYGAYIFAVQDVHRTISVANAIQKSGTVEWSNPNFVHLIALFNDPLYPAQYYLNNTGQDGGTANIDINAPEAWGLTMGCNDIRVAVIDDGLENHEDFDGRVVGGFTAGTNNTGGVPLNHPTKGHGVSCAGIIAATHDNNFGIRGVAPNSVLVPVNIFPNAPVSGNPAGAATSEEIATAIHWAWRPDLGNAHILSNSWGGGIPNADINTEISNARTSGRGGLGSIVVFASGNNGPVAVAYPGNVSGVVTVGAINRNGNIWNYSQRGPEMDLVAPSGDLNLTGDVRTTDRMGAWGYDAGNYTNQFGGTSAACPQVAGVAALVLSVNPGLTEAQVRTILQNTATDMGPAGFDNTFGYGRVNAYAAVQAAHPTITGPDYFCASADYVLANRPAGSTVTWTVSPVGAVEISAGGGNSSGITLSSSGYPPFSGTVTIEVEVTAACETYTVKKNVQVQPQLYADYLYYTVVSPNYLDYGGTVCRNIPTVIELNYEGGFDNDLLEFQWAILGGGPWTTSYWSGTNGRKATITPPYPYTGGNQITIVVEFAFANHPICEGYAAQEFVLNVVNCPPGSGGWGFSVYPNPASTELHVSFGDEAKIRAEGKTNDTAQIKEYRAILYDPNGRTVASGRSEGGKLTLDTSKLPNGSYYLHIRADGEKEVVKRQVLIKR